jgi:hypothetical protein
MTNSLIDDVYKLTKGKSTKNKIGSRSIPNRLTKAETEKLDIAIKRGFLVVTKETRINLINIYFSLCGVEKKACIFFTPEKEKVEIFCFNPNDIQLVEKFFRKKCVRLNGGSHLIAHKINREKFKIFIMHFYNRQSND